MVILCIWAYTLLAGTPPSLVRAALMCSLICLAKGLYGGKQSGLDALVLSAFIMLVFDPFYIMNISFQLSYASMLAITVCSPSLSRMQTSINKANLPRIAKKAISYILGIILISAIATLATAGIVAYHFSSISLVGLATNICISILASVLMTAAVVWWGIRIIGAVTTLAQTPIVQTIEGWVGDCIKWLLKSMNQTVDYFASFSQATLNWNASLIEAILYYMILATLAFWLYNHSAFSLKYPK
jgi:competence protein ComEC